VTDRRPAADRPARALFLGSGAFGVPIADVVADHGAVDLVAVVTAPPRPKGRGRQLRQTPIADWASERGLAVLTPPSLRDRHWIARLAEEQPELIVLADYGHIVPVDVLALPRYGALNLHPSLLPRHRGAAPVQAAIAAGDEETGVSLMLMDAGLDTGPVIAQRTIPLGGRETAPELESTLALAAARLLNEKLGQWLAGELTPTPQPAAGATVTRPLRREDGRLDPARPAQVLERQVRAFQPWPGSFLETDAGRLTVWQADGLPDEAADAMVGQLASAVSSAGGGLVLVTVDGLLALRDVQPAGGRRMSGADLLRGRPSLVGMHVRVAPAAASGQGR
jgi:methionyl-tRNA formyltransferase